MDSGAGHDSMNFASICPTVMIFSQCAGGISHHVEEYVSEKALEKVTEALIRTIIRLDKEI
jgi:acetylornithine deacetylase/succinyl-diaminopimelate desuccinylase-like protein